MSRTQRMRVLIKEHLDKNGECTTHEIYDYLNGRTRWGATMNQVTNVLAKDKDIERVGDYRHKQVARGSSYIIGLWRLKKED